MEPTACYPDKLAAALAQVFVPYLSKHSIQLKLDQWKPCLHQTFVAQPVAHRVEDGGSLVSTAIWHSPQGYDVFKQLRQRWTAQFLRTGLHNHILQHFSQGSKDPPLSADQLQPFLDDVKHCFAVSDTDWDQMLAIEQGQPFPDVQFLNELKSGVRLGVHNAIPPSPLWPVQPSTVSDVQDLHLCVSSWKSALDQPEVVWPLLEEECDAGFIEKVPDGLPQLQREYEHVAVGKLGLVTAEHGAPRLVVDSTVSGVTPNTCIPNRMLLPKIIDVLKAAPVCTSAIEMIAFTLDSGSLQSSSAYQDCLGGPRFTLLSVSGHLVQKQNFKIWCQSQWLLLVSSCRINGSYSSSCSTPSTFPVPIC